MATLNCGDKRTRVTGSKSSVPWSYAEAFKRHRGLINEEEQARLRTCRVGVVGMGGVGGVDLVTLARLGIGKFTIADPDIFEVSNTNRQHGAMSSTLGRRKADVMAEIVQDINPDAELRVFPEAIGAHNAEALSSTELMPLKSTCVVFSFDSRANAVSTLWGPDQSALAQSGWYSLRMTCHLTSTSTCVTTWIRLRSSPLTLRVWHRKRHIGATST
jgi:hypothetical protein